MPFYHPGRSLALSVLTFSLFLSILPAYPFYLFTNFAILSRLTVSPFLPPVSISALSVLTFSPFCLRPTGFHFTIWPFYQFYHFFALVSFTILTLASISGPLGFNIFTISLPPYWFYHFTTVPTPSIGRLAVLARLVSLFRLAMSVLPSRIPRLVALGILVDTAILTLLAPFFNLVGRSLRVVIAIVASLVSLICQWLG